VGRCRCDRGHGGARPDRIAGRRRGGGEGVGGGARSAAGGRPSPGGPYLWGGRRARSPAARSLSRRLRWAFASRHDERARRVRGAGPDAGRRAGGGVRQGGAAAGPAVSGGPAAGRAGGFVLRPGGAIAPRAHRPLPRLQLQRGEECLGAHGAGGGPGRGRPVSGGGCVSGVNRAVAGRAGGAGRGRDGVSSRGRCGRGGAQSATAGAAL